MNKGDKLQERKGWFVDNHLLGSKFDFEYVTRNLQVGFDMILNQPKLYYKKLKTDYNKIELCALLSILALTGARVSEGLSLKFRDITVEQDDDKTNWIIVYMPNLKQKKGAKKSIKKIPLMVTSKEDKSYFLYEMINLWYEIVRMELIKGIEANQVKEREAEDVPLFPTFNRHDIHWYCTRFCNINPHGLRKCKAQELVVEKDVPIKIVQRILGHRNLNNLEFYINLRTTDIKESLKKRYRDD
jgi:integrase